MFSRRNQWFLTFNSGKTFYSCQWLFSAPRLIQKENIKQRAELRQSKGFSTTERKKAGGYYEDCNSPEFVKTGMHRCKL
jgi:hypothetical protein